MRRLFCILLMLCLPLQSIAIQWEHASGQDATSLVHMLEHDKHVQHHHDDDGSIHYDNSDESAQHMQDHAGSTQLAGIAFPVQTVATAPLVTRAPPEPATFVPDPIPDCPHRPPSSSLG